MKVRIRILILCMILGWVNCAQDQVVEYPVTKQNDHSDDYFGKPVEDPYRWLEDMNSLDTKQWVRDQNEVTEAYLAGIGYRDKIRSRLTELWNYEKYSAPQKEGPYYVFSKNDGLQEQSVVYIQRELEGEPEVLLDPNTLSADGSISLTDLSFSKDQKYVSYGISRGGSDWREFYVMEVDTRELLKDHIQWAKFSGTSWYRDGFFTADMMSRKGRTS